MHVGYGLPEFLHDLSDDPVIGKSIKKGISQLFNKTDLFPTNKTSGRKFLLRDLIWQYVLEDFPVDKMPHCMSDTVKDVITIVQANLPLIVEHVFILHVLDESREGVEVITVAIPTLPKPI